MNLINLLIEILFLFPAFYSKLSQKTEYGDVTFRRERCLHAFSNSDTNFEQCNGINAEGYLMQGYDHLLTCTLNTTLERVETAFKEKVSNFTAHASIHFISNRTSIIPNFQVLQEGYSIAKIPIFDSSFRNYSPSDKSKLYCGIRIFQGTLINYTNLTINFAVINETLYRNFICVIELKGGRYQTSMKLKCKLDQSLLERFNDLQIQYCIEIDYKFDSSNCSNFVTINSSEFEMGMDKFKFKISPKYFRILGHVDGSIQNYILPSGYHPRILKPSKVWDCHLKFHSFDCY